MSIPFLDQAAFVTGAAQGLGKAIAHRVAREGANVIVADIDGAAASATAVEIAEYSGRRTLALALDVTDDRQVAEGMRRAVSVFGRLDLVVANAGIVSSGDATLFDAAAWRRVLAVNLFGYFFVARHSVPIMRRQRRGVILQINSISGKRGSYRNSAYCASKAAGIGLTQSLALEVADAGVRVNSICPGHLLDSPLWTDRLFRQYAERYQITEAEVRRRYLEAAPLRRSCTYDDVCNVVVMLASDQGAYLTGQAINVTGGQQME